MTILWHDHAKEKRLSRSQPLRWKELGRDILAVVLFIPAIVVCGFFLIFINEPDPKEVSYED